MTKRNNMIKIIAISIVFLFIISSLSSLTYSTSIQKLGINYNLNHTIKNSTSLLLDVKSASVTTSNINNNVWNISKINNPNLFGFNFSKQEKSTIVQVATNEILPSEMEKAASSGIQIDTIGYGDGFYVIGGINTSQSPLLLLYDVKTSNITDLSQDMPTNIRFISTISYFNGQFYIGGIPSGTQFPFAVLNITTEKIVSLSNYFPNFSSGPNIYASSVYGDEVYLGGYCQSSGSILFSYDTLNNNVKNLTSILPPESAMVLTLTVGNQELLVGGIYGNNSSFIILYNSSENSTINVKLQNGIESLQSSAYYNNTFFVGGSSTFGGELFEINEKGAVENISQNFINDIEIFSITPFNGNLFVGGWSSNGSFASIYDFDNSSVLKNITLCNGWAVNGSEILASNTDGNNLMIGGAITTQFYNYTGGMLGTLSKNYTFVDMSNIIPKTYQYINYSYPPTQEFYVYANPNIIPENGSLTFYGQDLAKNTTYNLTYYNYTVKVFTNNTGQFCYSAKLTNLSAGDYLIKLTDGVHTYYNYFGVLYNFGKMIYGAKIPKTNLIGYSNLKSGVVVRDGQYIEFYRQTEGSIPITSINYLAQWNQILFQNLTSKGWTVAPVNQLGYASQFSVNPFTFEYSFWNDYGISEVSTSGQFTNFPTSGSYIYVNGNEMIVWIPYSIVNETEFPWAFATDYVQNSPVYNPNYRIEAGQNFVSYFYANQTPSIINTTSNLYHVQFIQTGYPIGNGWEAVIINETGFIPSYYQNYSSTGNSLLISLPSGKYAYIIISGNPLYTSSNATGEFYLNNSNIKIIINFMISPITIYNQDYTSILGDQTIVYNVTPPRGYGYGPYSLNFGVMNSTLRFTVLNGNNIIYNKTIVGKPLSYTVLQRTNSYGYIDFNYTGKPIILILKNIDNRTGSFAYNLWDYYISNYTASLITIPPQFSENFNTNNFPAIYNNTGLSFTLQAPYYKEAMPLAIWIGEGYNNPVTGQFWWAQIGFNNWYLGDHDVSYAGWGVFSNIFGSHGGTGAKFPLMPNETYNFTMEVVNNDTWGFFVNGVPIQETGLTGFLNTTSNYANGGITLGFEVLSQARAGSPNATNLLPDPVKIIKALMVRVNGVWITVPNFSFNNVGENWNNGNTSTSMGMDLWSVEGNIQNKSIPNGEFIFSNSNMPLFNIPSYQNNTAYPLYGNYSYPYANISNYGTFINISLEKNNTIYIVPKFREVFVSLLELENNSNNLENFSNYIINHPIYIKNLYKGYKEALVAALPNNTSWEYGGNFQEIVITQLKKYNVEFTETGLPSGTTWYVNLTNGMDSGAITGSSYSFSLTNGTYSYTIATSDHTYRPSPSSGSFTVNG
ncbi:MAG: hypothetical protein QXE05_09495, partial [Nitrososphaeria archaeon]